MASFDPAALPRQWGDYELLEEVGRGGFGIIFKARQCCLNRLCAVKMLHAQDAAADAALTAEAQAAASLDHPNIVGIYEVGREEGRLFFSMEFVEGRNLASFTRTQVISAQRVGSYVRKIAAAVQYAHGRGVLHCDLKPANVIIDPDDQPQITDFGLARRVGLAGAAQQESEGAGSPNFMAPEQCDAQFGQIGAHTDVFGIGAILYYLLTDRPPFRGETFADTLRAVTQLDPVRPRALRPGVPIDLETICLRCLEKRPARRYHTAQEVVEELDRFLADEPIRARAINPAERLWRRARRHPWLAGFAAATLVLLGIVAFGSTLAALRIEGARQAAENGRQAVTLAQKRTAQNLYAADLTLAFEAWNSGNSRRVQEILERHRPTNGAADLRGWEWRFLNAQSRPDFVAELPPAGGDIRQIAILESGDLAVVADTANRLQVWSLADRRLLRELPVRSGGGYRFAVSADRRQVAVADHSARDADTVVRILALPGLETNATLVVPGIASVVAIRPDGGAVWTQDETGLRLSAIADGRELRRLDARSAGAIAVSPDGSRAAVPEEEGMLALLDLETGALLGRVLAHGRRLPWEHRVYSLKFSPDGARLASGGPDGTVAIWEADSLRPAARFSGHQDLVTALAFSADGRLLASAGRDPNLFVWDLGTRSLVAQPAGCSDLIFGLEFLPEADQFVSGGNDRRLRIWQPRGTPRWRVWDRLPRNSIVALLMPGGRHYLTATSRTGPVQLFRLKDGSEFARLDGQTNMLGNDLWISAADEVFGADYMPDGRIEVRRMHPAGDSYALREDDWTRFEPRMAAAVTFSPDGRSLAVGDGANGLRVWDLSSKRRILTFPEIQQPRVVQFSGDSLRLVSVSSNGEAVAVDLATGSLTRFEESVSLAQSVSFSPDQRLCAIPGFDGGVRLFDLGSGKLVTRLPARNGTLLSSVFSPDGTRLFAGSLDGFVNVWDLTTGREIAAAKVHQASVFSVGFTPDGTLVSAAIDGIRFWLTEDLPASP